MIDENALLPVFPVSSPWRNMLLESLKQVQQSLFMICPYIKDDIIAAMKDALLAREKPFPFAMRVITRALPDDFLSRSSDIAALQHLLRWPSELPCSMEIRIINNVHAKVWLFDTSLAIVGSGNATSSGLGGNLEYGLAVSEPSLVSRIQQDWQYWWEQATPTRGEELELMRQWLERMTGDEAFHQLEVETREKREAIERAIGSSPRIGKRFDVHERGEQRVSPKTAEVAAIYRAESTLMAAFLAQDEAKTSHLQASNILRVSPIDFWRALCWTYPSFEIAHNFQRHGKGPQGITQEGFLKLAWLSTPVDKPTLHCLWADGKRLSRTTIAGMNEQSSSVPSWAVTIDAQNIRQLAQYLHPLVTEHALADEQFTLALTLETQGGQHLHFSSIHADGTLADKMISCTFASIPGTFPILRLPISHITVQQIALVHALHALEQQWNATNGEEHRLTVIELFFDTSGPDALLTLGVGPLNAPLTLTIPGKDSVISGPEVRLRLDFASLQHIVAMTQQHDLFWCISTDRDLTVAQISPNPAILEDATLIWRHQLWNIHG